MAHLRGPYTITQLASITGVSVRTVRRYQQQGIIPHRREWGGGKALSMFYKVDIDRIRQVQKPSTY